MHYVNMYTSNIRKNTVLGIVFQPSPRVSSRMTWRRFSTCIDTHLYVQGLQMLLGVSIRFRLDQSTSATRLCCQYQWSVTLELESTWTLQRLQSVLCGCSAGALCKKE